MSHACFGADLAPCCRILRLAAGVALAALACGEPAPDAQKPAPRTRRLRRRLAPATCLPPPSSRPQQLLQDDLAAKRSPSDGGGRAWLEPGEDGPTQVTAGSSARFRLVYEVGPLGIAKGGAIFLQVSPFWGWSTPQVEDREAPGYTDGRGERQRHRARRRGRWARSCSSLKVAGRPLVAGERVTLVYGAGPAGAQHRSLRRARLALLVRGRRRRRRRARGAARFARGRRAAGRARPALRDAAEHGAPGRARSASRSRCSTGGQRGDAGRGRDRVRRVAAGLELPARVALAPADRGRKTVLGIAREPGIVRLRADGPDGLSAESNPLRDLARGAPRAVGRSARALELLGRNRHARGLLRLRARRRRARRRRAHRPRPLGHAAARRASRAVGRDPARDAAASTSPAAS